MHALPVTVSSFVRPTSGIASRFAAGLCRYTLLSLVCQNTLLFTTKPASKFLSLQKLCVLIFLVEEGCVVHHNNTCPSVFFFIPLCHRPLSSNAPRILYYILYILYIIYIHTSTYRYAPSRRYRPSRIPPMPAAPHPSFFYCSTSVSSCTSMWRARSSSNSTRKD